MIPLSALNHFLYCPRRCALIHVEGVFVENAYTVEGSMLHEAADTPGYEVAARVRVVRALPVFSFQLGLSGRADIVEFHNDVPLPVEYKRGKRKQWDNDDVQLCAQALCLEEMLDCDVPGGAVFHAATRRRRTVDFNSELRALTLRTIASVRELVEQKRLPLPVLAPQCEGCSMHGICLPELLPRLVTLAGQALYRPEETDGN